MKKIVTIIAALTMGSVAYSQTPITITAADMPMSTAMAPHAVIFASFLQPSPMRGTNLTWNYDTMSSASLSSWGYGPENRTYFTSVGINLSTTATKTFGNFNYPYFQKINYGSADVKVGGYTLPVIGSLIPGSTTDSVSTTYDSGLISNPITILKFPFTYNNNWNSLGGRFSMNFTFYIPSISASPKVIQQVFHNYRTDSVVAWGKMRVVAVSGSTLTNSIYYDVLMNRSFSYNVDSFYSGGSLLGATDPYATNLNLVQGSKTDSSRQTLFYRKGSFTPLLWLFHADNDVNYTQFTSALVDSSITRDVTSVEGVTKGSFISILYPNPAKDVVNMLITGKDISTVSYTIYDITGKTVQYGVANVKGSVISIDLNSTVMSGNYILYVADKANNFEMKEEFIIAK